jgi:putative glutamine amidotransferase
VIAVAWPQPDYLSALEGAGAAPRILDATRDALPGALDGCDGVMLTGGADVDPSRYGDAERHPTLKLNPARDDYEITLATLALDRDLPIFAICRGAQVLNVAAGGTLIQDIPTFHPSPLAHARRERPDLKAHDVQVAPHTCLAALIDPASHGEQHLTVNSRHHQSVRDVAPGFVVSAVGPDGIIEAIEKPAARFCLGVQWHPENFWRTGEFAWLFDGFVAAARRAARVPRTGADGAPDALVHPPGE